MQNNQKDQKEFWHTKRGKALIKLGLWGIFFLVIFVLSAVSSYNYKPNELETYHFRVYEDMINDLLKNNFEFSYKIKVEDKIYFFSGKSDGKKTLGIKETKENMLKYLIEDNITYKLNLEDKEEITNLYENLNVNYLNLTELFASLKDIHYHIEKHDNKRDILYDNGVIIKSDEYNIFSILIDEQTSSYEFNFTNLGKITL